MLEAWRRLAALALAALVAGCTADAAHAGTASGRPAQFTAGAGERNDLSVDAGSGAAVQFSDGGAPLDALLPWCVPFLLGQARCDPDGNPRYRVQDPLPGLVGTSRSTSRLVDGDGRPASSTARFVLGGDASVARVRVTLQRSMRRRLARSRSGALALFAQRVSRNASTEFPATGYDKFNVRVTIHRAARRA